MLSKTKKGLTCSLKILASLALSVPLLSQASAPSFDVSTNVLTLPNITVGSQTFNNVNVVINLIAGTATLQTFEDEHIFEMRTLLSPSAENADPAITTGGAAGSLMSIDTVTRELTGFIMTKGVTTLTAAHVHEGAVDASGPAIITLMLDSTTNQFTIPSGTVLNQSQMTALQAGNLYLNVHTTGNTGGELRGQLDINSGKTMDAMLTTFMDGTATSSSAAKPQ